MHADAGAMLGLILLQTITLGMTAYQWYFLMGKLEETVPFSRVFGVHLASTFVETLIPSVKIGGETVKISLLRGVTSLSHQELVGALLAHKYISLLPFVILCAPFITVAARLGAIPGVAYLALLGLVALFALVFWMLHTDGKRIPGATGAATKHESRLAQKTRAVRGFLGEAMTHS